MSAHQVARAVTPGIPETWLARIAGLKARGGRQILGIAGTPGSGKSSLAEALVAALGRQAALVPMDGFHLAQAELERLGRATRKGAPDTFDVAGYAALLRRLRHNQGHEMIYAPVFRREIEEPVAGAIPVGPDVQLIITEGNYLLLEDGGWNAVPPLLDACWYVDIDTEARIQRLIARHMRFGRSAEAAREWVLRSDEANAARIEQSLARADFIVHWPPQRTD